jgi:hypothetical protein
MPAQQPPSRAGLIISSADVDHYKRAYGDRITLETPSEFQSRVLLREEKEIGLLGGKFSGKSWVARAFLLKGNPDKPDFDPSTGQPILTNQSYIFNPNYRGLILRKNQVDLTDFITKFSVLCKPYGGVYRNSHFEFPASGAYIDCGHLADKDAWQKYIGNEYVRMVLEEAALIGDFSLYEQMLTCCRTIDTSMRPQLLLTSNAGGPGTSWLIERFYEAKDSDGNIIPPGNPIHDVVPDPYDPSAPPVITTRIFMFSTMQDNPHARNDPSYLATMANLKDEKLRAAYLHGDWKVFTGTYFQSFRPRGPHPGEPLNACHVIPANSPQALSLPYWTPVVGSLDVGYAHESAAYWARLTPSRQHHIYREFVTNQSSFIQIGLELAKRSMEDLNRLPSHSITFWISHDAFHNRQGSDGKSIAELLMIGAAKILGHKAVHCPELNIIDLKRREDAGDPIWIRDEDRQEAFRKLLSTRAAGITFRRANPDRVIGWQYCRESLVWEHYGLEHPPYDPSVATYLLHNHPDQYELYESFYANLQLPTLPKLIIHGPAKLKNGIYDPSGEDVQSTGCPRLIDAIPKARHYPLDSPGKSPEDVDKTHFKGMDSLDSWRYLEMGLTETLPEEPYESFRDRNVESAILHLQATAQLTPGQSPDGRTLVMMNRILEANWANRTSSGQMFNIPRKSRARHHKAFLENLEKTNLGVKSGFDI